MKRRILLAIVILIIPGTGLGGQRAPRTVDVWLTAADDLPPLLHPIQVGLTIEQARIGTYEPVIARITLTNRDAQPLTLEVRDDGAPHGIATLVAAVGESYVRHHQRLRSSTPAAETIDLAPGESTTGEVLILFGGPPTGFPFAEVGRYSVKVACQPDRRFAPVYSNEVMVTAQSDEGANLAFLRELSEVCYAYTGLDPQAVVKANGEDYIVGIRLLQRIIRQQKPHLIDPERKPADRKEAGLLKSLADLFKRHSDSSYSPYIARYLGLVHLKTFEHKFSQAEGKIWKDTGGPPKWDSATFRADASYQEALRYLTVADEAQVWPRTCAMYHLAMLHIIAQEWDKVGGFCESLQTKYAAANGEALAAELQQIANRYRTKLERRQRDGP